MSASSHRRWSGLSITSLALCVLVWKPKPFGRCGMDVFEHSCQGVSWSSCFLRRFVNRNQQNNMPILNFPRPLANEPSGCKRLFAWRDLAAHGNPKATGGDLPIGHAHVGSIAGEFPVEPTIF